MPYEFVVAWKDKRGHHSRFFKNINRAIHFSKGWIPPVFIYRVVKLTKEQKEYQKKCKWWLWRD